MNIKKLAFMRFLKFSVTFLQSSERWVRLPAPGTKLKGPQWGQAVRPVKGVNPAGGNPVK